MQGAVMEEENQTIRPLHKNAATLHSQWHFLNNVNCVTTCNADRNARAGVQVFSCTLLSKESTFSVIRPFRVSVWLIFSSVL